MSKTDNQAVYYEKVAPLVDQLYALCEQLSIPLFVANELSDGEQSVFVHSAFGLMDASPEMQHLGYFTVMTEEIGPYNG